MVIGHPLGRREENLFSFLRLLALLLLLLFLLDAAIVGGRAFTIVHIKETIGAATICASFVSSTLDGTVRVRVAAARFVTEARSGVAVLNESKIVCCNSVVVLMFYRTYTRIVVSVREGIEAILALFVVVFAV